MGPEEQHDEGEFLCFLLVYYTAPSGVVEASDLEPPTGMDNE